MPSILSFVFLLLSFLFLAPKSAISKIWINEFSPKSNPEWIEIYNDSDEEVILTDWQLVDDNEVADDINLNGCIKANSYRSFSPTKTTWLNNTGDVIYLKNNLGDIEDEIGYGDKGELEIPEENQSARRDPDGSDNWVVDDNTSKINEECEIDVPTEAPTSVPTEEPTKSPTEESTSIDPTIKIQSDLNNEDIKVGVKFYVDVQINNFEPNEDHHAKVRIGQSSDDMDLGRTEVNGDWLHDRSKWESFPVINSNKSIWTLRAKIKDGSPAGKYYLKVTTDTGIESNQVDFEAGQQPTPTPTVKNSPTPKPTKKPSPTPITEEKLTPTPTKKPTPSVEQSPTPSKTKNILSSLFNNDKQDKDDTGEVLGKSDTPKKVNKNRLISFGFIGIGGGCISAVGAWPYLQKIFATIKKDEQ